MKRVKASIVLSTLVIAACGGMLASCAKKAPAQDTRTAMQKNYKSKAECQKEFAQEGDCVQYTTTNGGVGFHSPFFYPWGAIMHSNGIMGYNERVPSSGYVRAPSAAQNLLSSRTNFNNVPRSYSNTYGGSTRGGFGSSGRSSASS